MSNAPRFYLPLIVLLLASIVHASDTPNVVIILADDLGWGDVACNNPDSKIATPNIDRLAQQGMRFTDAHSNAAWCTPSRYALMTGHYPWRERRKYDIGVIAPDRLTLPAMLRSQGYRTAMVGKWHLGFVGGVLDRDFTQPMKGGPVDRGFDSYFGIHASLDIPPYYYIQNDHAVAAPTLQIPAHFSPEWTEIQGAFWREGKISPDFKHEEVLKKFEQKAVEFIETQAKEKERAPFMLYLALTAPHTPWLPTDGYTQKSKVGLYGDWVQEVDDIAGNVISTIDRAGLGDNTLVLFTSDNGPVWYPHDVAKFGHRSSGPWRGMKDDMWEGGHRVPFIARWPNHVPGGKTDGHLMCFADVLATVAAAIGQKLPAGAGEDSVNMLPAFLGQKLDTEPRQTFVIDGRMLRKGPWKWVEGRPQGGLSRFSGENGFVVKDKDVLYNLADDPGELHNVAEKNPEVVAEMKKQLNEMRGGNKIPMGKY